MILSIILLLVMLTAFFHGLHRGFVRELVGFLGVLLVLGFALLTTDFFAVCYQAIGNLLVVNHNPVHLNFYRGLGFFSALLIATILVRLLARMLNVVAHVPLIKQFNSLLGGVVGLVTSIILSKILLSGLLLLQLSWLIALYDNSTIAQLLVTSVPRLLLP
ncbi:putative membrane ancor connecting MutS2 with cell-division Z-ring [Fructilactobacillus florum 8D]|uniref:Putative membrane ancor connecting MutS2 with cell-division Z-ring n=1 Tax=Fructilactobacillus florum 8D TaxID=1221538 RepID=W9ECS5_9LACO|nr:CvpA family protein [Fructilactobacillus florum]ETO39903.1 putative membrane ancor connecting MutS2 with cell-division Z-ring [Fructilactobacillus florum 8D]